MQELKQRIVDKLVGRAHVIEENRDKSPGAPTLMELLVYEFRKVITVDPYSTIQHYLRQTRLATPRRVYTEDEMLKCSRMTVLERKAYAAKLGKKPETLAVAVSNYRRKMREAEGQEGMSPEQRSELRDLRATERVALAAMMEREERNMKARAYRARRKINNMK